jgi:hypothetical protein
MRVEAAVFVHDDDAGQSGWRLGAAIGAERPHEVALDRAVALRRGHLDVFGANPFVVFCDLLAHCVIRRQCVDDHAGREAADGKLLRAAEEGAAIDLAVDVFVVELDGFDWNGSSFLR